MSKLLFGISAAALAVGVAGYAYAGSANTASSRSNQQHNTVSGGGQMECPNGQAWDSASRKCVPVNAINYNSSKSNTGNLTDEGKSSARISHPAPSAKYHCGKGEYMLQNGDCVPNPKSNPN